MARILFDTAQNVSTPAAGKYADLETKIEQIVTLVNEHAPALDNLDGNLADATAGGVVSNLAQPKFAIPVAHADHATETLVYKTTRKIEFVGMTVLKSAAGAGNTVKLTDGADADISDAVAADTDKAVTRAATLDPAKRTIAAGGTFKLVFARAAGSSLCEVVLDVLFRP